MDDSPLTDVELTSLFHRATRYRAKPSVDQMRVREPKPTFHTDFGFSERHLQAIWYDPALRPSSLTTMDGKPLVVISPGRWNLEAGPDFLDAVLCVGREKRRVEGDVEIHIRVAGWEQHGHAADPRYDRVRCHVTYFFESLADPKLPTGCLQVSLMKALQVDPTFSFETVDVSAYPYAVRAETPPCSLVMRNWSREQRQTVLYAAGEERLRRKSIRFTNQIEAWGIDQSLYAEVMISLGYKNNKVGFRMLSTLLPYAKLRSHAGHHEQVAYAILLGVAGLLPSQPQPDWDGVTKQFLRDLWTIWWKKQSLFDDLLSPDTWQLASLRPHNHPRRRLMAAAHLFTRNDSLHETWRSLASLSPTDCVKQAVNQLSRPPPGYWSNRLSLGGKPQGRPIALVGKGRAHAIIVNVLVPYLVAVHQGGPVAKGLLDHLPKEESHSILRETAFYLFGRDHTSRLYHSELARQGLVQIFQDFCVKDRTRCASCKFPALLEAFGDST